jgi:hypothetical protein
MSLFFGRGFFTRSSVVEGVCQVYDKTGSLTTLQQVMGHSSLQVSLTYLRGLEVAELKEADMPVLE